MEESKRDKKMGGVGCRTNSKDVGCGGQANGCPDMHMNVSSGERGKALNLVGKSATKELSQRLCPAHV